MKQVNFNSDNIKAPKAITKAFNKVIKTILNHRNSWNKKCLKLFIPGHVPEDKRMAYLQHYNFTRSTSEVGECVLLDDVIVASFQVGKAYRITYTLPKAPIHFEWPVASATVERTQKEASYCEKTPVSGANRQASQKEISFSLGTVNLYHDEHLPSKQALREACRIQQATPRSPARCFSCLLARIYI